MAFGAQFLRQRCATRRGSGMTEGKTTQEPTMEEILASIRRIISEDDKEAAPAANGKATNGNGSNGKHAAPPPPPPPAEEDDDLVLTDMVVGDGNVVAIDEDEAAGDAPEEITPEPEPEAEPMPIAEPE